MKYTAPLALSIAALASLVAAEAEPTVECQSYYQTDDPRLFRFVKTREAIDYKAFDGMQIDKIDYVVLPIFNEDNPREDNPLYKLINTLHIDTRPRVIAEQLTFDQEQPLNSRIVEENERLLRDNDYLSDAMIVPSRTCGDKISLIAVVRDVWTLSPSASFSRTGGENKSDVGISESNLLGTGQSLAIGRFRNDDRSGYSLSYGHDQLFGNHSELDLSYSNTSDGYVKDVRLERPFYSLNTRWASGFHSLQERRIDEITLNDLTLNTFRTDIENAEVFYGWSRGVEDSVARRWRVGFTSQSTDYAPITQSQEAPPQDRVLRYPWISYESIEDQYWTVSNLSHIGRQEDIRLGTYWFTRLGYASDSWGSNQDAVLYTINHQYTHSAGRHHLFQTETALHGRYNTDVDRTQSNFVTLAARYYHFIDEKNRWFASLRFDVADNIQQDEQLTSGGSDNLRGYPNDVQRGNQRWLFTVERRHFTDWHIFNLLRVGGGSLYRYWPDARHRNTRRRIDHQSGQHRLWVSLQLKQSQQKQSDSCRHCHTLARTLRHRRLPDTRHRQKLFLSLSLVSGSFIGKDTHHPLPLYRQVEITIRSLFDVTHTPHTVKQLVRCRHIVAVQLTQLYISKL